MTTTEFLEPKNASRADQMLEESKLPFEAFIRWWDEDKLQIDGNVSLSELKKLVEIMEGFSK